MDLRLPTLSLALGVQPPPVSGLTLALPQSQQIQRLSLGFPRIQPRQQFPALTLALPISTLPISTQTSQTIFRPVVPAQPIVHLQPLSLAQPALTIPRPLSLSPIPAIPAPGIPSFTGAMHPNLALVTQFKPPTLPLAQISLLPQTQMTLSEMPNLALVSQGKLPLPQISLSNVPGGILPTLPQSFLGGFTAPGFHGLPVSLPIATVPSVPSFPAQFVLINLWPTQTAHYARIRNILSRWVAYLDTSPMGSGKTVVTLKVAQELRLPMIVIGPLSTLAMWKSTAIKFGVPIIMTMSYQSMRGTAKNHPKHGLLTRIDEEIPHTGNKPKPKKPKMRTSFHPTATLTSYLKSGVLIVFDEMHNLKNPGTSQLMSAHAIVNEANRWAIDKQGNEQMSSAHVIIREAGK